MLKKLINSFKFAFQGIISAFKHETNVKIHILAMICVILLGVWLKISVGEWIILIILFSLVIAGELFNTAIEGVIDMVMPDKNEKAKFAKDVAAGAVLIFAIGSAIVGGIIFLPKIFMNY